MKAVDQQYGSLLHDTGNKDSSGRNILEFTGDPEMFWNEAGSFISGAAQAVNMDQASREAYINSLPTSGKGILVSITGRNPVDGTLNISVKPPEAKPTDSSNTSSSTIPEPGTEGACSQPHTSKVSITAGGGRNNNASTLTLTVAVDDTKKQVGSRQYDDLGSIYLCSSDEAHKTLGVTIAWSVFADDCTQADNLTISVEGDAVTYKDGTLTAVRSGTATLKVKLSYSDVKLEIDVPIEVH